MSSRPVDRRPRSACPFRPPHRERRRKAARRRRSFQGGLCTAGPLGGARVQYDLRKLLPFLNSMVLAKPEIFIGACATKLDADRRCVDETTRHFVSTHMQALASWIAGVHGFRTAHPGFVTG